MQIQYIDRATGNRLTESPPAEGLLRFLYDHPLGRTALLPLVKRKFISEWYGRRMNAPASRRRIEAFVDQLGIDMSESLRPVADFTSFNDFFYRKLKPEARPIGTGFVSPGDGRLLAFAEVTQVQEFFVKGRAFTLAEFLADEALAARYAGGTMLILRLAPNDYHRYHFPWAGVPAESRQINGSLYSVSPYALAGNFTRVFCENKRACCSLATEALGQVLLLPIGATMVGSMVDTYTPGASIAKGDEMGYFAFGGSTVVVLLEPGKLVVAEDLLANTAAGLETFVRMGENIGHPRT